MTPPDTTAPAPRRNVLPLPDLIRLTDWARANPNLCADTSNTKLAIIAGASLTLSVTAANVASVLEACGIEKTRRLPSPTVEERVGLIEEKLALLTGIIQGFREGLEAGDYFPPHEKTATQGRSIVDAADDMIKRSIESEAPCADLPPLAYHPVNPKANPFATCDPLDFPAVPEANQPCAD